MNASQLSASGRWAPLRNLGIVVLLGMLLGRLGPFDTFSEITPAARYAYWVGLTVFMWLNTSVAIHLLSDAFLTRPWPVRTVVAALIGAAPTTFAVAWAESLLRVSRDLGVLDLVMIYGDVAPLAVVVALPLETIDGHRIGIPERRHRVDASLAAAPAAANVRPEPCVSTADADPSRLDELIAELPPERRGRLVALEAEDHYLRVHTDRGSTLVHRRFSDALTDVAAIEGLRVHRSWWVARAAVAHVEREGDRLLLVTLDGLRVPVSRTYVLAVREAGLVSG